MYYCLYDEDRYDGNRESLAADLGPLRIYEPKELRAIRPILIANKNE
jgi:hypothetical protein